jgi:hypothetical protein
VGRTNDVSLGQRKVTTWLSARSVPANGVTAMSRRINESVCSRAGLRTSGAARYPLAAQSPKAAIDGGAV